MLGVCPQTAVGEPAPAGRPVTIAEPVMGINVQVCWEKFCNYWEVEARMVPWTATVSFVRPGGRGLCDENTIGVVAILGSTFDGSYERSRDRRRARRPPGPYRHRHRDPRRWGVGAMIAPFIDDDSSGTSAPRVASINTSGHKYGSCTPVSLGAVARPRRPAVRVGVQRELPGGNMPTFALNFSRPGAEVVAQYYTFLRSASAAFGPCSRPRATSPGPRRPHRPARALRAHHPGDHLPVLAFTTHPGITAWNVFDVSRRLRNGAGWCRRTRFPPTAKISACCGSWSARVLPRPGRSLRRGPHPFAPRARPPERPLQSAEEGAAFHH